MLFKQKKSERKVVIKSDVKDGIISYCKMTHPDEMVLILKGKTSPNVIRDRTGQAIYCTPLVRIPGDPE